MKAIFTTKIKLWYNNKQLQHEVKLVRVHNFNYYLTIHKK